MVADSYVQQPPKVKKEAKQQLAIKARNQMTVTMSAAAMTDNLNSSGIVANSKRVDVSGTSGNQSTKSNDRAISSANRESRVTFLQ